MIQSSQSTSLWYSFLFTKLRAGWFCICTEVNSQHRQIGYYLLYLYYLLPLSKQSLQKSWGCDLYLSHLPKCFSQVLFSFILNQHLKYLSDRSQHAIIYSLLFPYYVKTVIKFKSLRLIRCWLTLLRQLTSSTTSYQLTETLHSDFSMGPRMHLGLTYLFALAGRTAGNEKWQGTSDLSTGALCGGSHGLWPLLTVHQGRYTSGAQQKCLCLLPQLRIPQPASSQSRAAFHTTTLNTCWLCRDPGQDSPAALSLPGCCNTPSGLVASGRG